MLLGFNNARRERERKTNLHLMLFVRPTSFPLNYLPRRLFYTTNFMMRSLLNISIGSHNTPKRRRFICVPYKPFPLPTVSASRYFITPFSFSFGIQVIRIILSLGHRYCFDRFLWTRFPRLYIEIQIWAQMIP